MKKEITVVLELDLTHDALGKLEPTNEVRKAAREARWILRDLEPATPEILEGAKYSFVLDLPDNLAILGALVSLLEREKLSYSTRWFTGELNQNHT